MISGSIFKKKDYNLKNIFKKIFRIILVLICVTIIYSIEWNYNFNVKDLLENSYIVHLWYLYVIPGLYLLTPIYKKMCKILNNKDYIYCIIICFIIPSIIEFLNYKFNMEISVNFTGSFFPICFIYYITGYFLSNLENNKKNLIISIFTFLFSLIFYMILTLIITKYDTAHFTLVDDYKNLFVGLMSGSVFYIFKYNFESKKFKFQNIISEVALCTFGIYLFHSIIISKILNMNFINCNYIVAIIFMEILVFLISFIIIFILRRISIINKLL